jgi:hypothetical protein
MSISIAETQERSDREIGGLHRGTNHADLQIGTLREHLEAPSIEGYDGNKRNAKGPDLLLHSNRKPAHAASTTFLCLLSALGRSANRHMWGEEQWPGLAKGREGMQKKREDREGNKNRIH